jgi:hypothetical protein
MILMAGCGAESTPLVVEPPSCSRRVELVGLPTADPWNLPYVPADHRFHVQIAPPDPTTRVSVFGPDGQVAGNGVWIDFDNGLYSWAADAPLGSHWYDLEVSTCAGNDLTVVTFETFPAVEPEAFEATFLGNVIRDDDILEPSHDGLASLFTPGVWDIEVFGARQGPLLTLERTADTPPAWEGHLALMTQTPDGAVVQDLCEPTLEVPVHFDNPIFTIGPFDWPTTDAYALHDVTITASAYLGQFDGQPRLSTSVDLALQPSPVDLDCGRWHTCVPCGASTCVDVELRSGLTLAADRAVEPRTTAAIAADPSCSEAPP